MTHSASQPSTTASLDHTSADFSRVPVLDGLRALSIMAVLLSHFFVPTGPGGYGVFLFFIISGFLIARLLFAEQKIQPINIQGFFIRRIFRLYPVLMIFVLVAAYINYLETSNFPIGEILGAIFYFTNYLIVATEIRGEAWQIDAFRPLWSLAVEEHFYIAFPFLFVLLKSPLRILALAMVVIVGCTLARFFVARSNPELVGLHYFGMLTQFRIDAISFGVGLAAFCETKIADRILYIAARPAVVLVAFAVLVAGFVIPFGPAAKVAARWFLMGVPIVMLIAVLVFSKRYGFIRAVLNHWLMVFVGKLSYSLYIWHMLVGHLVWKVSDGFAAGVAATALSFVVAVLSYHLIEAPMVKLGRQLSNRKK